MGGSSCCGPPVVIYPLRVIQRRPLLAFAALALVALDGWWGYQHFYAPNADLTYAGLDSYGMVLPRSMQGTRLAKGKWDRDPTTVLNVDYGRGSVPRRVALVSLTSEITFGKAVAVIRDLKKRKICNLLITESSGFNSFMDLPEDQMLASALVLCGEPLGDAGWHGPLPPDRRIHVSPQA